MPEICSFSVVFASYLVLHVVRKRRLSEDAAAVLRRGAKLLLAADRNRRRAPAGRLADSAGMARGDAPVGPVLGRPLFLRRVGAGWRRRLPLGYGQRPRLLEPHPCSATRIGFKCVWRRRTEAARRPSRRKAKKTFPNRSLRKAAETFPNRSP